MNKQIAKEVFVKELERQAKREVAAFRKLVKDELGGYYKSHRDAKQTLERELNRFVKRHVAPDKEFNDTFDYEAKDLAQSLMHESPVDFIDDLMIYEHMISTHDWWLAEGQLDKSFEELLNDE